MEQRESYTSQRASNWLNPFSRYRLGLSSTQNLTIHPPASSTAAAGACHPWLLVHGFHTLLLAISQVHLCPQQGWYSRPVYLSVCSHADVTLNANDAIRLHFAGRLRRSFAVAFCSLLYPLPHRSVMSYLPEWTWSLWSTETKDLNFLTSQLGILNVEYNSCMLFSR